MTGGQGESAATGGPLLSVIVLTRDEEENLPACLESLEDLDCELFVVDSGSRDRTREIARSMGATVVEHPFENYARQRNWAQRNLPLRSEWVLHLDADERLTPELSREIQERLSGRSDLPEGFLVRSRTVFLGRWIRHGAHYPVYHLRLFRTSSGRCESRRYDQHFVASGRIERLEHDLVDVVASDLGVWSERHVRWARAEARELLADDRDAGPRLDASLVGGPRERRRWLRDRLYARLPLYLRAFGYWFYRYVLRLGFLDGREGFLFHFLQGFWYRILVDAFVDSHRRSEED